MVNFDVHDRTADRPAFEPAPDDLDLGQLRHADAPPRWRIWRDTPPKTRHFRHLGGGWGGG
jgi:hypothetical protein